MRSRRRKVRVIRGQMVMAGVMQMMHEARHRRSGRCICTRCTRRGMMMGMRVAGDVRHETRWRHHKCPAAAGREEIAENGMSPTHGQSGRLRDRRIAAVIPGKE